MMRWALASKTLKPQIILKYMSKWCVEAANMDGIGRKHKNIDNKYEKTHLGIKKHPNLPLFTYDFPWGRGAPKLMATCHAKTYAPDCI
jgi:hypothetical protein